MRAKESLSESWKRASPLAGFLGAFQKNEVSWKATVFQDTGGGLSRKNAGRVNGRNSRLLDVS